MSLSERLQEAKFVVDAEGNRAAAITDYALWEAIEAEGDEPGVPLENADQQLSRLRFGDEA